MPEQPAESVTVDACSLEQATANHLAEAGFTAQDGAILACVTCVCYLDRNGHQHYVPLASAGTEPSTQRMIVEQTLGYYDGDIPFPRCA